MGRKKLREERIETDARDGEEGLENRKRAAHHKRQYEPRYTRWEECNEKAATVTNSDHHGSKPHCLRTARSTPPERLCKGEMGAETTHGMVTAQNHGRARTAWGLATTQPDNTGALSTAQVRGQTPFNGGNNRRFMPR